MSLKHMIATVAVTVFVAACGRAEAPASLSLAASLTQPSAAAAVSGRPTSAFLAAGDYLVRFARLGCSANELNFSKHYDFVRIATGDKTFVTFTESSVVDDGLAHAAVCRTGSVSSGVVRVKMATPFTLTAGSDDQGLKIDAVFAYDTLPVRAGEGSLLGRGTYVVETSFELPCVQEEIVLAKSIRDLGQGVEDAIFRQAGVATDNQPRTLACMMNPPRSSGSAVLRATAPSTRLSLQTIYFGGPVPVAADATETPVIPSEGDQLRIEAIKMVTRLYKVL